MKFAAKLSVLILMLSHMTLMAAPIVMRFQPRVETTASKLGDVIDIWVTPNRAAPRSLKSHVWSTLPLNSHPIADEIITKDKIITWLTQQTGPITFTWQGKTQIKVISPTQSSGNALLEKARTALIEELDPHYLSTQVTAITHLKPSTYAIDDFQATPTLTYPTAKRVCVWLVHRTKKNIRIPVWFNVRAYARVLVANQSMHYNTPIKAQFFTEKERNIAGLNTAPARSLPSNFWLKSSIEHNSILLQSQLKEAPTIVQGQHLKVETHKGSITILMDAIALEEGYLGDIITVKNSLNKKTFRVKIRDSQQAEIAS